MEQKKQSFMQALDEFIRPNRQGYLFSVLTSILGVACSIVPYICAGQIITELIQGQTSVHKILPWVLLALAGYFLKVWMWSGHASASIISIPFCSHSWRSI